MCACIVYVCERDLWDACVFVFECIICHDVCRDQKTTLAGEDPPICHVRQNFLFTALYARYPGHMLLWILLFLHAPIVKDTG